MKSIEYYGYIVRSDGIILNKDGVSIKRFKRNVKGYLFTNFYYEGRSHCHTVHTFIWRAFNGEIPNGCEVDHVNNIRDDNRLDNLQLLTKSENNKKSYESGGRPRPIGLLNPNHKQRKYK